MKPLASPALARPFVETTKPAVARDWPLRPERAQTESAQTESAQTERPRRAEAGETVATEAAKRHLEQLAAHLRILQTSGAANPAMAAMLAYEMKAALGAYAAAGAVAPPPVGLDALRARDEPDAPPRRVSVVA
ncbi:hypothetical protein [uncultured Brevundimonas sp.]|uniref:hypothetical protein n=1 Tax=uncultured Brevundimonas sp. TaxID=213418 RepID=UPI002594B4EB|nr:hypothetical protein [uncultured Brevundimonas sp.]